MKKLLWVALIFLYVSINHIEAIGSDTGLGTDPFSTGGSLTAGDANAINNAVNTKVDRAGDTLTGELVLDELGVEFQPTDGISDCSSYAATGGGIFFDDSEGKLKKCEDNVLSDLDTGGSTAYDNIGNPTGAGSISFDDGETATYDGAWDTEVAVTLSLNAADLIGDTTGLLITAVDNDDANYIPFLIQDDQDGTPDDLFKVDYTGLVTAAGGFSGDGSALTAVDAATGDSATAFFDAGAIELPRGGLGIDLSAYNGLIRISGGSTSNVTDAAGLETALSLGAYASDLLGTTNEANFKAIVNLEAGTDFEAVDAEIMRADTNDSISADMTWNGTNAFNGLVTMGNNIALNANKITSIEDVVIKLGDNAGLYSFIIQDSDNVEQFAVDSNGVISQPAIDNPYIALLEDTGISAYVQVNDTTADLLEFSTDSTAGSNVLAYLQLEGAGIGDYYVTGDIHTGSSYYFVDADASPSVVGELQYDNTITGLDDGGLVWYDDDEIRIIIDLDASEGTLASGDDGKYVKYNWNAGSGYFTLDAPSGGSLGSNLSSSTNDITTDNSVIQLIGNSEDIDIEFGANSADVTTDTGVTEIDFISIALKEDGNDIYNSGDTPGGELGGTWASPTLDETGIALTSITIGALLGVDSIDATGAVDMDYGSADVTDHTFTSDGGTVVIDGGITTAGVIKGRAEYGADVTVSTAHDTTETHGVFYHFTAAATVTLDAAADSGYGAQACYRLRDAAEAAVIDIQAAEKINFEGTALAAGTAITATGAGEAVCMVSTTDTDGSGTDGWEAWGATSGWASE
jgi:hypothetical protein